MLPTSYTCPQAPRPTGPHLQDVVAVGITQVPHANLRAHVPAAEGGCRELQAPNFQQHVGHCWEGVPAQAQGREPLQPGGVRAWDQPCGALLTGPPPGQPSPPPIPAPLVLTWGAPGGPRGPVRRAEQRVLEPHLGSGAAGVAHQSGRFLGSSHAGCRAAGRGAGDGNEGPNLVPSSGTSFFGISHPLSQ